MLLSNQTIRNTFFALASLTSTQPLSSVNVWLDLEVSNKATTVKITYYKRNKHVNFLEEQIQVKKKKARKKLKTYIFEVWIDRVS